MSRDHAGPRLQATRPVIALTLVALFAVLTACSSATPAVPTPAATPGLPATATSPAAAPLPIATPEATATIVAATATPAGPYGHAADVNPLTGLKVAAPASLARRPLLVVINNSPIARDVQSGLTQADLVYEYIMEGIGTTRFTTVYLANEAAGIRPLRSARLVDLYLTPQYDGALVASGANGQINWFLTNQMGQPYLNTDIADPDSLHYATSIGSRSDYETRLQTDTGKLRRWLADVKGEADPRLRGFAFAEARPAGEAALRAAVDYPATVIWDYDASSGRYLRSMAGTPHKDAAAGKRIDAANVIIQTVKEEATDYVEDSLGDTSIRIITVGEGPVIVLRDGVALRGVWRASETGMPEFVDATGKPIALKPGNSWFELVAAGDRVTIK